jgi:hypothetical protein
MKTKDNKAKKNIHNLKKSICPRCGEISYITWVLDKKYWMCISCLKTWAVKQDSKAEQTENNIPQGTSS